MLYQNLSLSELQALAFKLGLNYQKRDIVIGLVGNLGSGKTTFAKSFAKALKIKKLKSPSFTILSVYGFQNRQLFHLDFYRLNHLSELEELGVKELLAGKNRIILIEWADKFPKILKACDLILKFKIISNNRRNVTSYNT